MLVADQRPAERALHGVVHPDTRLERTERPEAHVLVCRRDARRERERARRAHQRAQLCVQRECRVDVLRALRQAPLVARDDSRVEQRAEHHADHECGEDVTQGERERRGKCGLLQRGDPQEDEEVHRSLETRLREAEDQEQRVCGVSVSGSR